MINGCALENFLLGITKNLVHIHTSHAPKTPQNIYQTSIHLPLHYVLLPNTPKKTLRIPQIIPHTHHYRFTYPSRHPLIPTRHHTAVPYIWRGTVLPLFGLYEASYRRQGYKITSLAKGLYMKNFLDFSFGYRSSCVHRISLTTCFKLLSKL